MPTADIGEDSERLQRFNLAMGPMLDLLELSGYAIVVSELHQSAEMWDVIRSLWDRYLDLKPRIQFLKTVLQTADIPGLFASGELLRTGWRMQVQQLLRDLPVDDVTTGSPPFGIHVRERVRHPSALVRTLGAEMIGLFYRGIDVFTAMYFVKLPGNEDAAAGLQAGGLIDALSDRSARRRRTVQEKSNEEANE